LETDINDYGKRVGEHKVQLESLLRELEKLRAEQADAVADIVTAREEKDISDVLSGIAEDGTAAELQRLRQLRQEVKAEARVSKELAGTDTRSQEADFLSYARDSQSESEFDKLIGLAGAVEKAPPAAAEMKEKEAAPGLPE
jgi:phage shock protein A